MSFIVSARQRAKTDCLRHGWRCQAYMDVFTAGLCSMWLAETMNEALYFDLSLSRMRS